MPSSAKNAFIQFTHDACSCVHMNYQLNKADLKERMNMNVTFLAGRS